MTFIKTLYNAFYHFSSTKFCLSQNLLFQNLSEQHHKLFLPRFTPALKTPSKHLPILFILFNAQVAFSLNFGYEHKKIVLSQSCCKVLIFQVQVSAFSHMKSE